MTTTDVERMLAEMGKRAPLVRAIYEETANVLAEQGIAAKDSDLAVTLGMRLTALFAEEESGTGGSASVERAMKAFHSKRADLSEEALNRVRLALANIQNQAEHDIRAGKADGTFLFQIEADARAAIGKGAL